MAFERFSTNNNRGTSSFKGERPGVYGIPLGISIGAGVRNPRIPSKPGGGNPPLGGPLPPFQGGSAAAGPITPISGPLGGTMIPGGERPSTYDVKPGALQQGMGKGQPKALPAPWQEVGRFQGLNMPAWTFRRSGVKLEDSLLRNKKPGPNKPPPSNDKPTVPGPVQPPGTQWGNPTAPFPQNPYDVPAPLNPANNPWLASLPQRDWMTMPSASPGYEQAPPPGPWRPPY